MVGLRLFHPFICPLYSKAPLSTSPSPVLCLPQHPRQAQSSTQCPCPGRVNTAACLCLGALPRLPGLAHSFPSSFSNKFKKIHLNETQRKKDRTSFIHWLASSWDGPGTCRSVQLSRVAGRYPTTCCHLLSPRELGSGARGHE